jgi:alkylation response protein AidB-like acyl-CoA dehydrogenase
MDLELSNTQKSLVDSARRFFARQYPLERMRQIYLLNDEFERALWRDICDLGWNAAALPVSIGGFDGGLVEAQLLLAEMGRGGCVTPYPHSSVAAAVPLAAVDGGLATSIAESGMVVMPVPLSLMRDAPTLTGRRIHAHATPVAWPQLATHLLCETGARVVLVATDQPSVAMVSLATSRGEPLGEIHLNGAAATDIAPASMFHKVRDHGAFACAALLQGICERALELAVEYAKQREQFGRPIGSFQAIQHKAADMHIATEVGRVLVLRAAAEREPDRFSMAASRAKAWTSDAARKVTRDAMQIFGGISFAGDHPIQLMYESVITLANHYGQAHQHRARLAGRLLR